MRKSVFHDEVQTQDVNEVCAVQNTSGRPGKQWNTNKLSDAFSWNTVRLYYKAMKVYREIKPPINAKLYLLMDQSKKVYRDQT